LIYFNFSFIVLSIVTMRFVIVLINELDDDDDDDDDIGVCSTRLCRPERE